MGYRIFVVIFLLLPFHYYAEEQFQIPKLIVSGTAVIKKPADEVRLLIGVVTQNQKADIARKTNQDQMIVMINMIKELGLSSKEYQTAQFMIQPVYNTPPKNPPSDWIAEIIGYKAENSIEIRTVQLELLGKIIDKAAQAGANSVDLLEFGLHDSQQHTAEVIEASAKNAFARAETLANAAHVRLKRILEINLENVQGGKRWMERRFFSANAMAKAHETFTPIEAGDIEMTGNVHLVYEIEPLSK